MRILILGGGISGLSAAWYAKKKYPSAQITLLEKQSRLGGVIETKREGSALIEMGPRTFSVSRSSSLLELIEELDLEIIYSKKEASQRYLLQNSCLKPLRSFLPMIGKGLLKEALTPARADPEESIYDFASRRFGKKIAKNLFDPITLGIYAGDIHKLSLAACFPYLHELEKNKCSLLRSLFHKGKKDHRLFTLKGGIQSLIDALQEKLSIELLLDTTVEKIERNGVFASGQFFEADLMISALPQKVLQTICASPIEIPTNSLWTVHMGFEQDILKKKGFGYLVPTKEKEALMGMVFDSVIFPRTSNQFFLTAMIRNQGDQVWAEKKALCALKRHLDCHVMPSFIECHLKKEAIPQYELQHFEKIEQFKEEIAERFPNIKLAGNYLDGVSVDACVKIAKELFYPIKL